MKSKNKIWVWLFSKEGPAPKITDFPTKQANCIRGRGLELHTPKKITKLKPNRPKNRTEI